MKKRLTPILLPNNMCWHPFLGTNQIFDVSWIEKEFNEPYGFVYRLFDLTNDKIYIGKTINSPLSRFKQHVSDARNGNHRLICKAIREHGEESFELEVLRNCYSKEELDAKEIEYIIKTKSTNPDIGYNMVINDSIFFLSKKRVDKGTKGRNNVMLGRSLYEIWVEKHGKLQADQLLLEFKEKQRSLAKAKYDPKKLTSRGTNHTEELKNRFSRERKGTGNPMYGKSVYDIWIAKYGYEKAMEMKTADIEKKRLSRKNKHK